MTYIPTGTELIDPFKVLEAAGIKSGMRVADFGCGTLGHYVFPAAHQVGPSGKVFAVDILKSVLNGVESKIKMDGVANVESVWGDIERSNGVTIPDNSLDLGLLINNLFMSSQKAAMMKECVRMVKPGGTFVVVDWKPAGVNFGPDPKLKVTPEEAKALATGAGLKIEKDFEPGQYHYGFVCTKP